MKKISLLLLILIMAMMLASCKGDEDPREEKESETEKNDDPSGGFNGEDDVLDYGGTYMNNEFVMTATVLNVSDLIEVEIISAPYENTGIFWVITSDNTAFLDANGRNIGKSDITPGDTVSITYGGQVMMSYPPKIVAYSITVE